MWPLWSATSLTDVAHAASWLVKIAAMLVVADTLSATLLGLTLYYGGLWTSTSLPLSQEEEPCSKVAKGSKRSPRVLVQLPMYNERQVYKRIIAAACLLDWPADSLVVQVLDDSTEADISEGMKNEVQAWCQRGHDVRYRQRKERHGYKAGNLREGLLQPYAAACDYVAILDADFEPTPDWLRQTVPHLEADPRLALVQTRWSFSNEKDCLLTRWQAIEMRWHFLAEQLSGSHAMGYFGFNGTAGVWRLDAVVEAGSWSGDTVTEDMDMAVSAAGLGWHFKMLPHVECLSELPSTFSAYRKQQHRWTCGPAALLHKHFLSLLLSQAVGWPRKLYMLVLYVGLRRVVRPLATAAAWLLLALSLLAPQAVEAPYMALACLALLHPACYFAFSPRLLPLLPSCALFVSALAPLRVQAIVAGLWGFSSSRAWTVTEKRGRTVTSSLIAIESVEPPQPDSLKLGPCEPDSQGKDASAATPLCVQQNGFHYGKEAVHKISEQKSVGDSCWFHHAERFLLEAWQQEGRPCRKQQRQRWFLLEVMTGACLVGAALYGSLQHHLQWLPWLSTSLLVLQGGALLAFGLGLVSSSTTTD